MANSYTSRLKKRLPAPADTNWDDEWHDNERLDEVVAGALLSSNRVISGGAVTAGSGLNANYAEVTVWVAGVLVTLGSSSIGLTPAAVGAIKVNWIYINSSGAIVASVTAPSGDYVPLAMVDVSDTAIVHIADLRPMQSIVPTAALGTATGQIASTEFVKNAGAALDDARVNHIIDGDFNFWFEATSQTSNGYGSDTMFFNSHSGSTKVHSRQAFTLGQTDVPGNLKYYSRTVVTSVVGANNLVRKQIKIEDVSKLAGKTVTFSIWAKADSSKNIAVEFEQFFGTSGTPSANVAGIGSQLVPLTTGWQKKSITVDIPSISGKTLGTAGNDCLIIVLWFEAGSTYDASTANLGQQSGTFDIARVRLVEGEVDGDSINCNYTEELVKLNRYFFTTKSTASGGTPLFVEGYNSTPRFIISNFMFPVEMRAVPVATIVGSFTLYNCTTLTASANAISFKIQATVTATGSAYFYPTNIANDYLKFDARL